ncbi:MAG: response regulator [Opitutae bacterium]|nr:response regulator [Opitutae bacterium]
MLTARKILVVEDAAADFELISAELGRDSGWLDVKRVDSCAALAEELEHELPHVVLCDHGSARWDSLAVLAQVRARDTDLPFIIVTGTIPAATAQQAFAHGVDDVVLKDQLHCLRPAVRRALHLAEEIAARRKVEQERDHLAVELLTVRRQLSARLGMVRICSSCKRIPEAAGQWVQLEEYLHRHLAIDFTHGLCPECVRKYLPALP